MRVSFLKRRSGEIPGRRLAFRQQIGLFHAALKYIYRFSGQTATAERTAQHLQCHLLEVRQLRKLDDVFAGRSLPTDGTSVLRLLRMSLPFTRQRA